MYQSILVPLDGSAFSEQALPSAAALARRAHATLHLVHVHVPLVIAYAGVLPLDDIDPQVEADSHERELAYLERVRLRVIRDGDVRVLTALLDAPVVPALVDYQHAHAIDLTVMTTHGRGGFTRFWIGSTTDTLLRESMLPTLLIRTAECTVPPTPVLRCKEILIPLDGSAEAEAILESVVALGTLMESRYTLFRVVEPYMLVGYDPVVYAGGPGVEAAAQEHAAACGYLEQVADRLQRQGVPGPIGQRVVYTQQAASAILEDTREHAIDAIAMATHGRRGPSRLLLGSTADKVIRGTHLPVLVYHPCPLDNHNRGAKYQAAEVQMSG